VRKSVGRDLRERDVTRVVDEVLALRDAGAQAIAFEDDSLLVHRARFLRLADELVRRGVALPWMANARPDELDGERVDAARAAGAALLKVGVDSGSPRLIEHLGKTGDGPGWIAATERGFALLEKSGIGSVALFMIGMPDETLADAESTLAPRVASSGYLQVRLLPPLPGRCAVDELRMTRGTARPDYHYLAAERQLQRIRGRTDEMHDASTGRFYLPPGFFAAREPRAPLAVLVSVARSGVRAAGRARYLLAGGKGLPGNRPCAGALSDRGSRASPPPPQHPRGGRSRFAAAAAIPRRAGIAKTILCARFARDRC